MKTLTKEEMGILKVKKTMSEKKNYYHQFGNSRGKSVNLKTIEIIHPLK